MSTIPKDLQYTKSHEWLKFIDETTVEIGITDFAQHALGDIVFVNLPQVGDSVAIMDVFADVESVKAVSDIYSPVSGTVIEINAELLDAPELLNKEPYEAWIVRIRDVEEIEETLDAEAYEKLTVEEA